MELGERVAKTEAELRGVQYTLNRHEEDLMATRTMAQETAITVRELMRTFDARVKLLVTSIILGGAVTLISVLVSLANLMKH